MSDSWREWAAIDHWALGDEYVEIVTHVALGPGQLLVSLHQRHHYGLGLPCLRTFLMRTVDHYRLFYVMLARHPGGPPIAPPPETLPGMTGGRGDPFPVDEDDTRVRGIVSTNPAFQIDLLNPEDHGH